MKVLTIGTFDMLHEGHLKLFRAGKKLAGPGDLIVGVNSDEFVQRYRGKPSVMSYNTRAAVVGAVRQVSWVHKNDGPGKDVIRSLRPDILLIGSDWAARDYYAQIGMTQKELDGYGILLVYVPYTEGISSTKLKEGLRPICVAGKDGDCNWSKCPQLTNYQLRCPLAIPEEDV